MRFALSLAMLLQFSMARANTLEDCVALLSRGLEAVREPVTLPTNEVALRETDAALRFIGAFAGQFEGADGELYRREAQTACSESAKAPPSLRNAADLGQLVVRISRVLADERARETLTVLRINAHWALHRVPPREDFLTSARRLGEVQFYDEAARASFARANRHSLSEDEYFALRAYVSMAFRSVNASLRPGGDPAELARNQPLIDMINSALTKLPNFAGTVQRGTTLPPDELARHLDAAAAKDAKAKVLAYPAFTSTSRGDGYFPGAHRFVIRSRTGKNVAAYAGQGIEEEVLFRTGTRFRVERVDQTVRPIVFYLEEVAE